MHALFNSRVGRVWGRALEFILITPTCREAENGSDTGVVAHLILELSTDLCVCDPHNSISTKHSAHRLLLLADTNTMSLAY